MNASEQRLYEAFTKQGANVLRNGWPDFMIVRNDRAFAIELKVGKDKLRPEQVAMHAVLRDLGLPVYVARDGWQSLLTKRGRAFLTKDSLEAVRMEALRLRGLIASYELALRRLEGHLDESAALCEPLDLHRSRNVVQLHRQAVALTAAGDSA